MPHYHLFPGFSDQVLFQDPATSSNDICLQENWYDHQQRNAHKTITIVFHVGINYMKQVVEICHVRSNSTVE